MMRDDSNLLPRHELDDRLNAAVEKILKGQPGSGGDGSSVSTELHLPELSFKARGVCLKFRFPARGEEAFVQTVKVVSRHFDSVRVDCNRFHYELTLEKKPSLLAPKPEDRPPMVTLHLHGDESTLYYDRAGGFSELDLSCAIDLWRKLALPNPEDEIDPAARLASIGVRVFADDASLGYDRLRGFSALKEAIEETIVLPSKHPDMFAGIASLTREFPATNTPRAILFEGPPGTGKTTAARILASRMECPLVHVPVESVVSKWYGQSSKRLAEIFSLAKQLKTPVVFLDEIDSLATSRDGNMHEATRRVLSVLLRELAGLEKDTHSVLVGATNRPEDLDPALMSRFSRRIRFELPNEDDRAEIFGLYAKHLERAERNELAQLSNGASGRDIEEACSDAERAWAAKLIGDNATEPAPPAIETYRAAIARRSGGA